MFTNMFIYIDCSIYINMYRKYIYNQYIYIHMCKLYTCIYRERGLQSPPLVFVRVEREILPRRAPHRLRRPIFVLYMHIYRYIYK